MHSHLGRGIILAAVLLGVGARSAVADYYNSFHFTWASDVNPVCWITGYDGPGGAVVVPSSLPATIAGTTVHMKVISIEARAFEGCTNITSIRIADSIGSIGNLAFADCSNMTSVTFGSGVTVIGDMAFSGCARLAGASLPASILGLGEGAFAGCTGLTSVTLPNQITEIRDFTFSGCAKLTGISVPAKVQSIGTYSFANCASITSLALPSSVKTIGLRAFAGCSKLNEVALGDNLAGIGSAAFEGCGSLANVTIPASVTSIGELVFRGCAGLATITVASSNTVYASLEGVLFDKARTTILQYPGNRVGDYTIPASVTGMATGAFDGCKGLTAIAVEEPNTVYSALDGILFDKALTTLCLYPAGKDGNVTIPAGVHSVGPRAFAYCANLTSLTIPGSVGTIGNAAFYQCANLASLTLGDGVASIGDNAFDSCTSLTGVTIPDSVTSIGAHAFRSCTNLTFATISDGVTSIGAHAFRSCTSLTRVTVGRSVTTIGDSAFEDCGQLQRIYFRGNAPSVGVNAFGSTPHLDCYFLPATSGWGPKLGGCWTEPWRVRITFAAGGGSDPEAQDAAYLGTYGALPNPWRYGYSFEGWWTGDPGAGTQVTESTVVTIDFDHTLYARWNVRTFTLYFDADFGTVSPASKAVVFGTPYGDLPTPVRSGHTFLGWHVGDLGTGDLISSSTTVGSGLNLVENHPNTLHAHWTLTMDDQAITFPPLPGKRYGDVDFSPGATASSGLAVGYTSSNPAVATIVAGRIRITGIGSTTITASQAGGGTWNAAADVTQALTVAKGMPVIIWDNPAAINYGQALSATQLNARSDVPGVFAYTPAAGSILAAGQQALGVTFTPTDTARYSSAQKSVTLTVRKTAATVILDGLIQVYDGRPHPLTARTIPPGLRVDITYAATSVPVAAGSYPFTATVIDDNATGSRTGTMVVAKGKQTLTFPAPPPLRLGDEDCPLAASSTSGLGVGYGSSAPAVATIVGGNKLHVVGAGKVTITAFQQGDANWKPAASVARTLTIGRTSQTIDFAPLPVHLVGAVDLLPAATASSGLPVVLASDNPKVASIVAGRIHAVGRGSAVITATQSGNARWDAAAPVNRPLSVAGQPQTITFPALPDCGYGSVDFAPVASASSGLPPAYSSSNPAVATIVGGKIRPTGLGTCTITARQPGNTLWEAAAEASQPLAVIKGDPILAWAAPKAISYGTVLTATQLNAKANVPGALAYAPPPGAKLPAGQQTLNVTFIPTDTARYNNAQRSVPLTVNKARAKVVLSGLSQEFTGQPCPVGVTTVPGGLAVETTYNGAPGAPSFPGTYAVVSVVNDPNAAGRASGNLVIRKGNQTIHFAPLAAMLVGDADIPPPAYADSGLPVAYASSTPAVATIVDGRIHVVGPGTAVIAASQAGNSNWNAAPVARQTLTVRWVASAVGSFFALTDPDADPGPGNGLGGRLDLTVSTGGVCTGKLSFRSQSFPFRAWLDPLSGATPTLRAEIPRKGQEALVLELVFGADNHISGTLGDGTGALVEVHGWKHLWNATKNPAWGGKDRVLNVALRNPGTGGPRGDGFATIKLARSGLATWTGTLADGTGFKGTFMASPAGQVPLCLALAAPAYPGQGSVMALLATTIQDGLVRAEIPADANGRWIKIGSPSTSDRTYRSGFDLELLVHGAEYRPPATGQRLFGAEAFPHPLDLVMQGDGLDTASAFTAFASGGVVTLDALLRPGNILAITQSGVHVPVTLAPSSGVLAGSTALADLVAGKSVPRTLTLKGLYIPCPDDPSASAVAGFCLLSELPATGQGAATTPIHSGRVWLGK